MGVPKYVLNALEEINLGVPKLPSKEKLIEQFSRDVYPIDESDIIVKTNFKKLYADQNRMRVDELLSDVRKNLTHQILMSPKGPVKATDKKGRLTSIERKIRTLEESGQFLLKLKNYLYKDLPQGSPTSPLLTIFALNKFIEQGEDAVFYADDGIFFSNKPIEILNSTKIGAFIHPDKSRYIVEGGKVLGELKFLGLTYNLEKRTLRASTRKGSTLELMDSVFKLYN